MGFGVQVIVYGVLALFFGAVTVKSVRRLATVARMLRRGVRTTGTCVRVTSRPHQRSDAKRYHFAFRTDDGQAVEFEELAEWSMAEGTTVTVAYDPRDPRRTATIAGRGSSAPVVQSLTLVVGCGLATVGFTALFLFELLGGCLLYTSPDTGPASPAGPVRAADLPSGQVGVPVPLPVPVPGRAARPSSPSSRPGRRASSCSSPPSTSR